jgi:hypothetical protein
MRLATSVLIATVWALVADVVAVIWAAEGRTLYALLAVIISILWLGLAELTNLRLDRQLEQRPPNFEIRVPR